MATPERGGMIVTCIYRVTKDESSCYPMFAELQLMLVKLKLILVPLTSYKVGK